MSTANGQVMFLNCNDNGIWSVKLDDEQYYSFYKTQPKCDQGDLVTFEFTKRGKYNNADARTVQVQTQTKQVQNAGAEGVAQKTTTQEIIQYQAARNSALTFIGTALQQEAIKLATKKEDRYDQLMGLLHEVTEQFMLEAANLGPVDVPFEDVSNGKYGEE